MPRSVTVSEKEIQDVADLFADVAHRRTMRQMLDEILTPTELRDLALHYARAALGQPALELRALASLPLWKVFDEMLRDPPQLDAAPVLKDRLPFLVDDQDAIRRGVCLGFKEGRLPLRRILEPLALGHVFVRRYPDRSESGVSGS